MKAIDDKYLRTRILHRKNDTHKGDYGHLLIMAGCQTMPGAAVLATGAALHSGCGLVTLLSSGRALQAAANAFPSAILAERPESSGALSLDLSRYTVIAAGPGLGLSSPAVEQLTDILAFARQAGVPTVLDADALTILPTLPCPDWTALIPEGSVLTPHLGELRRLLWWNSEEGKEDAIRQLCEQTRSVLVMKGYHTRVYLPDGDCLVNTTGNPGLAKGGSGDVLTGLIGGLMARSYDATDAACLGVWIHGRAGDVLTEEKTAEAWSSRDLIDYLYAGFKALYAKG